MRGILEAATGVLSNIKSRSRKNPANIVIPGKGKQIFHIIVARVRRLCFHRCLSLGSGGGGGVIWSLVLCRRGYPLARPVPWGGASPNQAHSQVVYLGYPYGQDQDRTGEGRRYSPKQYQLLHSLRRG